MLAQSLIHRLLYRSPLPVLHIVGLVAARDEDSFRTPYRICDKRVHRRVLVGNRERRNGIQLAQLFYVRVVLVVASRGKDEEVASISARTKPSKCWILVSAASHQGCALLRLRGYVIRMSYTGVAIVGLSPVGRGCAHVDNETSRTNVTRCTISAWDLRGLTSQQARVYKAAFVPRRTFRHETATSRSVHKRVDQLADFTNPAEMVRETAQTYPKLALM